MPHDPSRSRSRSRSRDRSTDEPVSIGESADHDVSTDCEGQQSSLDAKKHLVHGVSDFKGERLHFLQIGLGTYGTFVHSLAKLEEFPSGAIDWIIEHLSNTSTSLRGVAVEPVPEHLNKLVPSLKLLPNTTLVRAAVSSQSKESEVYTLTEEMYAKILAKVPEEKREDFEWRIGYLRNMSCVGMKHPCIETLHGQLFEEFDLKLDLEPVGTQTVTYAELCRLLNFRGVEALVVDAEGHDEAILGSMIDYCVKHDDAWPDFIQFESMWDGDLSLAEVVNCQRDIVAELEQHGYLTIGIGHDTQMMRRVALEREARLQTWIDEFNCEHCKTTGEDCMPFGYSGFSTYLACGNCGNFYRAYWANWEDWVKLPAHVAEDLQSNTAGSSLVRLVTDGKALFGFSGCGAIYSHSESGWDHLGDREGLRSLAVSGLGKMAVAVDDKHVAWTSDMQAKPWQWTRLSTDTSVSRVCVSLIGNTMCALGTDDQLHVGDPLQKEPLYAEWGPFVDFAASASGNDVWGINAEGEVWGREGKQGYWWFDYAPKMLRIAVSGDGRHVWGVSVDNKLFFRRWEYNWAQVPGFVNDVAVNYDGSTIWVLDGNGAAWACPLWSVH